MADAEATKALSGLLNGIAQKVYYNNSDITEELLNTELFPELARDQFTALHDKMRGLLKVNTTPASWTLACSVCLSVCLFVCMTTKHLENKTSICIS